MNGSLCIANDNYSIEIDPNHRFGRLKNLQDETLNNILDNIRDDFLFCIRNKKVPIDETNNDDIIMGIDTEGNGYFKGNLTANSGSIGGWNIGTSMLSCNGDNGGTLNLDAKNGCIYSISYNNREKTVLTAGYISSTDGEYETQLNETQPELFTEQYLN